MVTEGGATDDFVGVESGFKIQSMAVEGIDPNGKPIYYREPNQAHLIELFRSARRKSGGAPIIDSNFKNWDHAAGRLIDLFQSR
jgi:hypothetical protein